jgi:hypothetical protein
MNTPRFHEDIMTRTSPTPPRSVSWYGLASLLLACSMAATGAHAAAAPTGTSFTSPEQAADALAAAWHDGRVAQVIAVLGPGAATLIRSGDPVAKTQARERLAAAWDAAHRIEETGPAGAILVLGAEAWPYPIPLVRHGAFWRFDVKAGAQQIRDRRIGRNELTAIELCRAYVEAQRDYSAKSPTHDYAQKIASSAGRHDGLYWRAAGNDADSPFGALVEAAEARGYDPASAEWRAPYQGYSYRILTAQGAEAPGGARSYLVNGRMTGGFALLAIPAAYGDSGVMSFLVDQNGIVFEKNLGPDTLTEAGRISAYNPDRSWKAVAP